MPRPKRRLGQHFLSDPRILARIADALGAGPSDTVLEIGPGPGGLTAALAERAGRVIAIEKDRDLADALQARFHNVTVVEGDALELDWRSVAGSDYLLAGNIPYNITTPLIDKALDPPPPRRLVFLVQREVADRLIAAPGTGEYGALTVGVQAAATAERLFSVPAGAFRPRPDVDSAVLRLTPRAIPLVPDAERRAFRRLVVGLFSYRRKQLLRGLREFTGWESERVHALIESAAMVPTERPEQLAPEQFVGLYCGLVDGGWTAG
ncbi:MAG: ribosomal RNA small subunit methyltransferase A [Gemmatimonadales bacterium]|nr:ribosomal RNA small subunit methyltransferase A [Gemmatimonadales bacterium]